LLGRILAGAVGTALVVAVLVSSIETVVVPRAYQTMLTRLHFVVLRRVFGLFARPGQPFERRDRVMALYAPMSLVLLPGLWVVLVMAGFTAIFWAVGVRPLSEAFVTSGSSLLTLGFVRPEGTGGVALAFVEAVIGLGLISLMISYLPTIYGAFSRREALVGMLEIRAGQPPSTARLLTRYLRIGWLDCIHDDLWPSWSAWFVDIEESHTSQPSLVFFRSPHPERSWITAAGCVLDTAAMVRSTLALPNDARTDMLIRTGFLSLRRIADYFDLPYEPDPLPTGPISVSRAEFDELCDELRAAGVPLQTDLDQAWRDFTGWRVNYDAVLVGLCRLVMAPPARWSSDRPAPPLRYPRIRRPSRARRQPL
jgi:hypothetical protein